MDIIFKSLVSAAVTAIILVIAKISGPKLAGAIGGIPIVFAVSYVLLTWHERAGARDFLVGAILGAVAAVFFSILLITLNAQFERSHWANFIAAYILCFVFALLLVKLTGK